MATTTPNFGWPVPTSTDLVKNGATAIEGLGDAIDASLLDLKGGTTGQVLAKATNTDMDFTWVAQDDSNAIQNAIVDAKGDLIAATANDTPARLAVGTNGQVLTADSTASTGLKWADAAGGGGGMTLLSTTTLSGASTSITVTPTGYNQILVYVYGATNGSNGNVFLGLNSNTTAGDYVQSWQGNEGTVNYEGTNVGVAGVNAIIPGQAGWKGSDANGFAQFIIYAPTLTTRKLINSSSAFYSGSNLDCSQMTVCNFISTAALSSVQVKTTVGTFTAGTALVYGVK